MQTACLPQRKMRPLPERIPRQKAYLYVFLIVLTTILMCLYSYPLETKNWAVRPVATFFKSIYGDSYNNSAIYIDDFSSEDTSKDETDLQKLSVVQEKITNIIEDFKISASSPRVQDGELPEISKIEPSMTTTVKEPASVDNPRSDSSTHAKKEFDETNGILADSTISGEMVTTEDSNQHFTNTHLVDRNKYDTDKFSTTFSDKSEILETTQDYSVRSSISSDVTQESLNTIPQKISSEVATQVASSSKSIQEMIKTSLTQDSTVTSTHSHASSESTETIGKFLPVENTTSGVGKGFLVFSENCRIPDLDPMHPSIRHFVSKTPPLDCSKDYKPLTTTKGHFLYLNEKAIRERTSGHKFSCCYRPVVRENDGKSDDDVGFGKECTEIIHKTKINDEFVKVECQYVNGTEPVKFYTEYHSFIHDKPEVERRCKKRAKDAPPRYSVLVVGADAVSRMNMHRQLNSTAEYLLKEMGAVEMFGFNKVGDNTFPNLVAMLTGYDERELPSVCWKSDKLPLDRCNFLWKRFAAKGYRTFYAEDAPHMSSFNYVKEGFLHQPTDYYFRHFIRAYQKELGRDRNLNCYWCVGSTSETEAVLHWTEQFAARFADRPYFAFSWINSLTHDDLNWGSMGDHMYEIFFRTLHKTGALNATIIIFMGDHGMRWGEFRSTYIGRLEERLPMLLIALPEDFKKEQPHFTKNLQTNAHRLVTPFDLHATLANILNLETNWTFTNVDDIGGELAENFTKRAISLFQPVPEDRSCDDAFIDEHWCTCERPIEAKTSSNAVKQVANFLVNHINALLKSESDKCAQLGLQSISDARLWQPPSEHKGHHAEDNIYTVVIHAKPGGGVFEGTVKVSGPKQDKLLLGSISRLNLYGNQSICVHNAILRKYCYCL